MRKRLSAPLIFLMALVGIVLAIACANLAGIMLARAAARRHELAVRSALGASHARLVRQLLSESLLLSVSGAVVGFAVAIWTSRLLTTIMWTHPLPLVLDARPDIRVLLFTIAASLLTALLFGLAPAWKAARTDPADALRKNTRSISGSAGRFARCLIVGQIALSLLVILAAALFVRSLRNIENANIGFDRSGVLVMQLMSQPGRQLLSGQAAYYRELVDRIDRLPGVVAASFSVMGPVNRGESKDPVAAEASGGSPEMAAGDVVGPGFFRMIGMNVLTGREFNWNDDASAQRVVVLSQSLADRLFPAGDAVGRYVIVDPGVNQRKCQVAGIVNSASLWRVQHREPRAIYFPLLQTGPTGTYLDIRSAGDPAAIAAAASKIVENLGHDYPLYIQTLQERMNRMTVDERMIAWLSTFFGTLALLLACIGLYGLTADSVIRRRPEIGIRMALGAERGNVIRLVLREVLLLVGVGLLIGIPVALMASRTIGAMLFGLSPTDPESIVLATVILLTVAIFAGFLPARAASRTDPMATLRSD
jgi:predicted permease